MSAVCMEWFLVTDFFMFYFLHLAASETPEKVPLFRSGLNAWKKNEPLSKDTQTTGTGYTMECEYFT